MPLLVLGDSVKYPPFDIEKYPPPDLGIDHEKW